MEGARTIKLILKLNSISDAMFTNNASRTDDAITLLIVDFLDSLFYLEIDMQNRLLYINMGNSGSLVCQFNGVCRDS